MRRSIGLIGACPAVGLALGLAGCAAGPPAPALDALLGWTPTTLVHALGVPARIWRGDGILFMAFYRRIGAVIPRSGPVAEKPFSTPAPFSAGTGLATPPELVIRVRDRPAHCGAAAIRVSAVVGRYSLRSPASG